MSIPDELLDAAKIDGCSFFGIFRWILLPLSPPTFAVVGLGQFTGMWNAYLLPVVVLGNPARAPVNVAISNFSTLGVQPWNVQMAAAMISTLPCIAVYLLLGSAFMRGLMAGSMTGQ
jgi:glucose/mannose transport system permease protein